MSATVADLLCRACSDWRETLAHPDEEKPGSLRICAQGHTTHAWTWKPCWTPRTPARLLEAAHEAGRLFW